MNRTPKTPKGIAKTGNAFFKGASAQRLTAGQHPNQRVIAFYIMMIQGSQCVQTD